MLASECFTKDELFWIRQSIKKEREEMIEFRYMIDRTKSTNVLILGLDRLAARMTLVRSITEVISTLDNILEKTNDVA
ncbi:MAG: hypothetical protein WBE34_17975 [Candidatus Nitrosopolaris sp.]